MIRQLTLLSAVAALAAATATPAAAVDAMPKRELLHSWTKMEFALANEADRKAYEDNKVYAKTVLAGVKVAKDGTSFVTTPRWLDAKVPASLSRVVKRGGKSVLEPWPSAKQNDLATSGGLRNALGMAVDSRNRLWVLDMGNVAGEDKVPDGAIKLVIFDIASGREVKRHAFPDGVVDRATSFINDLVLDEDRQIAFISDSGVRGGSPTPSGIIVYDLTTNTSRRVLDKHASVQNDLARPLKVNGEDVFPGKPLAVGINGVTLSADRKTLYWSITSGDGIYSAPTAALLDAKLTADALAKSVDGPIRIDGGSDGLVTDRKGRIIVTNLTRNSVLALDPKSKTLTTIAEGTDMIWPDTIGLAANGDLVFSSNHLNHAFGGAMKFDGTSPNFKIWRVRMSAR
jgi:sugar lactone lactonase YvrE